MKFELSITPFLYCERKCKLHDGYIEQIIVRLTMGAPNRPSEVPGPMDVSMKVKMASSTEAP